MREFLVAVAVCVALVGCDNKPSTSTSTGTSTTSGTSGTTKTAEPAKAKHPWTSFKVGSFAKLKTSTDMEVGGNKMKSESTMVQTLKALDADSYTLETEMIIPNVPPQKSETKIPLKGPEGAKTDGPKPKTGSEDVEVAGKKFKCTTTEMETDAGGTKMTTKVWTSDEVPGGTVKSVSKSATMTSTTELVEFASK